MAFDNEFQRLQARADLEDQWVKLLKIQGIEEPRNDSRWPHIKAAIERQLNDCNTPCLVVRIDNEAA